MKRVKAIIIMKTLLFFVFGNSKVKAQSDSAKLKLHFKTSLKYSEDTSDELLLTDSAFFCVTYEKNNKLYTNHICMYDLKGKRIKSNQYYKDSSWSWNILVYLPLSKEVVLYQKTIPSYPKTSKHTVYIFDSNLEKRKKINLEFGKKRFLSFNVVKNNFVFFLIDDDGVYHYTYNRKGNLLKTQTLPIKPSEYASVEVLGQSNSGDILLWGKSLNSASRKKVLDPNKADIRDYLSNEIVDYTSNNATSLILFRFSWFGELLHEITIPRQNHDVIFSLCHMNKNDYLVGVECNFLQGDKEHYEFIQVKNDTLAYRKKKLYNSKTEKYSGSLVPNLMTTYDNRYLLSYTPSGWRFKLTLQSGSTFKKIDEFEVGGWPYQDMQRNSRNQFLVTADKYIYLFSVEE